MRKPKGRSLQRLVMLSLVLVLPMANGCGASVMPTISDTIPTPVTSGKIPLTSPAPSKRAVPTTFLVDVKNPALGISQDWDHWPAIGSIIKSGGAYYMYYTAGIFGGGQVGLAVATSPDGPWKKYGIPILATGAPGEWDDYALAQPRVYKFGQTYYMYYGANQNTWRGGRYPWRIGMATASSPEGPWTKHSGNPILNPGELGAWDGLGISLGSVSRVGDEYWMWYVGWNEQLDEYAQIGISIAKIPEGPWASFEGNPVFAPRGWSLFGSQEPLVIRLDDGYHMWYAGLPVVGDTHYADIGYAHSPDGIRWTDYENNPVLKRGPEEYNISEPFVFIEDETFFLFYTRYEYPSFDYSIYLAKGKSQSERR